MGSATGIEIGHDSCVLVGVRPRRGRPTEVRAFQIVEGADWPAQHAALPALFRLVRRTKKLPRRARVVAWALPDGANLRDPAAVSVLRPLTAAGFRVEAVLSPAQALAALAGTQRRTEATAWLALNIQGAAIAIVRGGELLFSRTFEWTYKQDVVGTRAQLLQRYSLVSQLAPELRRGIATVRLEHDETIATVVTCGDLPELRSLTMPLIEELDLEVETLDSTDGLEAVGKARMERFAESAPVLRLACAAGEMASAPGRFVRPAWPRVAAAAVIVAVLGAGALVIRNRQAPPPVQTAGPNRPAPAARPGAATGPGTAVVPRSATPAVLGAAKASTPGTATAPVTGTPRPSIPASAGAPAVGPRGGPASVSVLPAAAPAAAPKPPASSAGSPGPASVSGGRSAASTAPVIPRASVPAVPVAPRPAAPSSASVPAPSVRTAAPTLPAATLPPAGRPSGSTGPAPSAAGAQPAMRAPGAAVPVAPQVREPSSPASGRPVARAARPLPDPLPKVDSVLIDQQRRLAIVDGAVVAVGDTLGPRVVVAINRDGIVLREASGHEVRVPLRSAFGR